LKDDAGLVVVLVVQYKWKVHRDPRLLMLSQVRESGAPLVLVIVSVLSAVATIVKAEYWVGIAAAVAAVLSGGVVLRAQIVVPTRIKSAMSACVPGHGGAL
jgi:hypothetical protein